MDDELTSQPLDWEARAIRRPEVECDHCGVVVQDGPFCAACGAHLTHAHQDRAARRRPAFVAAPHEPVHQPAILTTLLPHLTQFRAHTYRWALVAGAAIVVGALLLANVGVAVVAAAFVVPIMYVVYIHDADVHEGEPLAVVALTVGYGALVGVLVALLTRAYVVRYALPGLLGSIDHPPPASLLLLLGVTVPILTELVKLVGPLGLRRWPHFKNEVMDGAVFGVAAGVGFAAGSTLVNYWPFIRGGYSPVGAAGLSDWAATLLGLAILRPLIHGTTAALIGMGAWAALLRRGAVVPPVALGLAGAVLYSLGELVLLHRGTLIVLAFHAALLAGLLTILRHVMHEALLGDARALGLEGGTVACRNCHRTTEARVFCTHCGVALRAQPKGLRGHVTS